jgi:arylsulfatase A-like enzyme
MGRTAAAAGLAALALAPAGCSRREKTLVHDLVRAAPAAEAEFSWEYLAFGSLAALPFQEKGFERELVQPFSDTHAAVRVAPQIVLRWGEPAPRLAILDAAPYPGVAAPSAQVLLNGRAVGQLALAEGRRRYTFALPAEVQRRGGNRLRLEFAAPRASRSPAGPAPLFARLYGLSVGAGADADLSWLGRDGAPPPVGIGQGPRARAVVQVGPSAVRFAFPAPGHAELRFTPDLHARARSARGAAVFSVAVADGAAEREIWHRRVSAGDAAPEEVTLDLPVQTGSAATVVLRVRPDGDRRPAWGLWQGLRVMGDPAGVPVEDLPRPDSNGDGGRRHEGLSEANVLLVILDAAGARHFGCYGYARRTTPEIDRIAAEGVLYERAYSPAVFTRSSMASIWTSQYPDQHRVGIDEDVGISGQRATLAELLSARGVHTAGFIGNPVARGFGLDRGFDEFHSVYRQKVNLGLVTRAEAFREVLPPFFKGRPAGRMFTYVHYLEPHFPYDPPAPFNTMFGPDAPLSLQQRREKEWFWAVNEGRAAATTPEIEHLTRLYDGGLAYVDREVGFLRRTLEEAGLWDRTLVIISSDHGEGLYEHGWIGHMKQVHEEATHVPLVVRYPAGAGPAGTRVNEVVSLLDLAPTIADVLGLAVPAGAFRGRSLLAGGPGGRVVTRNTDRDPTYAVTEDRYRLLYLTTNRTEELYDVRADPAEKSDLAGAQPAWAAAHRQALQRFLLSLVPETPSPIKPLAPAELEALRALGYVH